MSHGNGGFANLTNGWSVQSFSPGVEHFEVVTNEGGNTDPSNPGSTRYDIKVEAHFRNTDPIVIRFNGSAAFGQIYAHLDLSISNHSGFNWEGFNISAVDQESSPDSADYSSNIAHPFFSHFHDVAYDSYNFFTRSAWNSVLGRSEPNNAGNSWEFNGGNYTNGEITPLEFLNFRTHQYNKVGDTGGSFYVILTPDKSQVDYSGYLIREDLNNLDFIAGDEGGTSPRKDMLFGYKGNDTLNAGDLADIVYGDIGNDRIRGAEGDDILVGGSGADILNGGPGADEMRGEAGNDNYRVNSSADRTIEAADGTDFGGVDSVLSTVNHTLQAAIENLRLVGSNLNGTGNNRDNLIVGTNGRNVLNGDLGSDTLKGRGGPDVYVFDTKPEATNVDQIVGFSSVDDTIRLENAVFANIATGRLAAGAFKDLTSDPADANDRILYNSDTGSVFYDRDGTGAGARVLFAVIGNDPALTASDFQIV